MSSWGSSTSLVRAQSMSLLTAPRMQQITLRQVFINSSVRITITTLLLACTAAWALSTQRSCPGSHASKSRNACRACARQQAHMLLPLAVNTSRCQVRCEAESQALLSSTQVLNAISLISSTSCCSAL
eukprot:1696345-Amphidinium_carterae.1